MPGGGAGASLPDGAPAEEALFGGLGGDSGRKRKTCASYDVWSSGQSTLISLPTSSSPPVGVRSASSASVGEAAGGREALPQTCAQAVWQNVPHRTHVAAALAPK